MIRRVPSLSLHGLILTGLLVSPLFAAGSEEVHFERPDGAVVAGTFHTVPSGDGEKRPAVLLIHQAQASRAEFDFLLPELHALGFHTLAIDLRGHGASSKPEKVDRDFFMKLFKDPDYAPPDVEAIVRWLAARDAVDAERIAIMGGSVGANLAYMAVGANWPVKTAVVLSGNSKNANLLATKVDGFKPANVLLIAADQDHGREEFAYEMFEQAGDPKRIEILKGSGAHGASMLSESEEMRGIVLDWLKTQLE